MTMTYYLRNSAVAVGFETGEYELQLNEAAGSSTQNIVGDSGKEEDNIPFIFTTPANSPGSSSWPSGTYEVYFNISAADANTVYGFKLFNTYTTVSGGFKRISADTNTAYETAVQAEGNFSGTGVKHATTSWTPSAGSSSDRFSIVLACENGSHSNETITIDTDNPSADSSNGGIASGPWTAATPVASSGVFNLGFEEELVSSAIEVFGSRSPITQSTVKTLEYNTDITPSSSILALTNTKMASKDDAINISNSNSLNISKIELLEWAKNLAKSNSVPFDYGSSITPQSSIIALTWLQKLNKLKSIATSWKQELDTSKDLLLDWSAITNVQQSSILALEKLATLSKSNSVNIGTRLSLNKDSILNLGKTLGITPSSNSTPLSWLQGLSKSDILNLYAGGTSDSRIFVVVSGKKRKECSITGAVGYHRLGRIFPRTYLKESFPRKSKDFIANVYVSPPGVTSVSASHIFVLSILSELANSSDSNLEWRQELSTTQQIPLSWLQKLAQSNQIIPGWLQSLTKNHTLPLSWIQKLAQSNTLNLSWKQRLALSKTFDISWRNPLSTSRTLPLSWLSSFNTNQILPLSWLQGISQLNTLNTSWLTEGEAIIASRALNLDWKNQLSVDNTLPFNWQQSLSLNRTIPLSWLLKISQNNILNLSSKLTLDTTNDLDNEWRKQFNTDRILPLAWTLNINQNNTLPLSWLQGISQSNIINLDWLSEGEAIIAYATLDLDWRNQLNISNIIPLTWISDIDSVSNIISIDWLKGLAGENILPDSWLGKFNQTNIIDIDNLGIFEDGNTIDMGWKNPVSNDNLLDIDNIKDIPASSSIIPVMWLPTIQETHIINDSWRGVITDLETLNLDWWAQLISVAQNYVLNIDFKSEIAQSDTITIEKLQKLAKSCILLIDWTYGFTSIGSQIWTPPLRNKTWIIPKNNISWIIPERDTIWTFS